MGRLLSSLYDTLLATDGVKKAMVGCDINVRFRPKLVFCLPGRVAVAARDNSSPPSGGFDFLDETRIICRWGSRIPGICPSKTVPRPIPVSVARQTWALFRTIR